MLFWCLMLGKTIIILTFKISIKTNYCPFRLSNQYLVFLKEGRPFFVSPFTSQSETKSTSLTPTGEEESRCQKEQHNMAVHCCRRTKVSKESSLLSSPTLCVGRILQHPQTSPVMTATLKHRNNPQKEDRE